MPNYQDYIKLGFHNIKDFGVGLAKGVGQLAEAPGYAADLDW